MKRVTVEKCVTIEDVIAWHPCHAYTRARIELLFAGREYLTASDIAALVESGEISAKDGLWALLHNEFLTDEQMRDAARHWALGVVHLWDAPEVVVQFLRSGDETLRFAAFVAWQNARDAADSDADADADADAREAALDASLYAIDAPILLAALYALYASASALDALYASGAGLDVFNAAKAQVYYLLGVIEGKELSRA
jgi:hypothetical protein